MPAPRPRSEAKAAVIGSDCHRAAIMLACVPPRAVAVARWRPVPTPRTAGPVMSPPIFIRPHTPPFAVSFTAALALIMFGETVPAQSSIAMTPRSIWSTDTPSDLFTPVRCQQESCYTYEQWARPGFNRKKERPSAGPGKANPAKFNECMSHHDRLARDCL